MVTPEQILGPYYVPSAPERAELDLYGDPGPRLVFTGRVRDACGPVAGAVIELWHADPGGAYDEGAEMRYRARQRTRGDGAFAFHTVHPGVYRDDDCVRPAHLHVRVRVRGRVRLTTQIYFAGDPHLAADRHAVPELVVDVIAGVARFDLVLTGS